MVTVDMEVVNFFQPRIPACSLPFSQPPQPPVLQKEKGRKVVFAQPNSQRVSGVDSRSLGSNDKAGSEFPVEQLLRKLPTDTAAAKPSKSAHHSDELVLNDHGKPSNKAELEPPYQVQNGGSGSTQESPIAIDDDDDDDDDNEMQSISGDIDCINAERDAKPCKDPSFDSEPERALSSARHELPLSPNDLLVQSLDEAEQLNLDSIAQNVREVSAPENLPSISNKESTEWGDKELAEFLKEATQSLEGEEETAAVVPPKSPPGFTGQSPLHINKEHRPSEQLEGEEQTIAERTSEPVSEPEVRGQCGEKRCCQNGIQETANDTWQPDSGDHSDGYREKKDNDDDDEDPRPPMKRRKKSPKHSGDAALTPPNEHRPWRRLGRRLSPTSDTTHLSVESEALPNPGEDWRSGASQTFRSSSATRELMAAAEYQEWPFQGILKCTTIGNEITYNVVFKLPRVSGCVSLPINVTALGIPSDGKTSTSPASVHGTQSQPKTLSTTKEAESKRGK
ncbi:hypothetical protein K469DRAFT_684356 [Zopfia rhizophila CBS 207.26]|uniref:Uncharacterized protein n=1 Tax=Zopfia rhizophila CBS 207.26 TaxID=1314779 RepID=A0A6A6EDI2_9PEZI|nr:hypothetical protein K469DRAFT_684356 [Zopfia rhizophila CBS 207.26]